MLFLDETQQQSFIYEWTRTHFGRTIDHMLVYEFEVETTCSLINKGRSLERLANVCGTTIPPTEAYEKKIWMW